MLIGDVAQRSGISTRMLRHYDALGLVTPTGRTHGGYREYSDADVRRLFHVESLRSLGLTLAQTKQALDDQRAEPPRVVADLIRRTEDRLRRETELLDRLRALQSSSVTDWRGVLGVVELMRDLDSPSATRRLQAVLSQPDAGALSTDVVARAVLTESDPNVAGALRWALDRSGVQAVDAFLDGAASADTGIRRRAVQGLRGLPGSPAADEALTRALGDADAHVRHRAALTLGERGRADAISVLVAMIVAGADDVEAAETLGSLVRDGHGDTVVRELQAALTTHPTNTAPRLRIAQAVMEMPSHAAPVLRELARDDDSDVARVASTFLDMLHDRGIDN